MHRKIKIFAIVFLLGFISCNDEIPPVPQLNLPAKALELIDANNAFGLELFKKLYNSYPDDENIFISPTSVSLALAMTYNGAREETKAAFEECLQVQGLSVDEINESYKSLMDGLMGLDPDVILKIANSIWYRQGFDVLQDFIDVNVQYYNAQVSALDFNSPSALNTINGWVADNTNNKITSIIDNIPDETVMYLINAIYFKGVWKYTFDVGNTHNLPFYNEDGTIPEIPTMMLKGDLNKSTNNLFSAVELPYGNENYSMVLILPNDNVPLGDVVTSLNSANWSTWTESFEQSNALEIYLPRFTFEYEKTLNDVLSSLGLGIAFSPSEADFTGINPEGNLFISLVKHKTFVEVNEEGTEAAAVTIVGIDLGSIGDGNTVHFNKPFLFAIKEKTTNAIVFIGKIGKLQ